ncbi:MAG: hypothetical protein V4474_04525, partial [Patescibacteria group bacterium]
LGWNPGGEQEIFTMEDLLTLFSIERVHKAGGVFDIEKLKWFNHEHLKLLSDEEYAKRLREFSGREFDMRLVPLIKERAQTLAEATGLIQEYDFVTTEPNPDCELLLQGGKLSAETTSNHLKALAELLEHIPDEGFTAAQLKDILWPYATDQGRGEVLWPLRVALSGAEKSPDPFTIAGLIGKKTTLTRIAQALTKL